MHVNFKSFFRYFTARIYLSVVASLLVLAGSCDASNILVLHSYHRGYTWTDSVKTGMEEVLKQEIPESTLFVENMDTKRYPPEEMIPRLRNLLAAKYAGTTFDLILCSDDNALDFLLTYRDQLFPGVPVVFCGINNFGETRLAGHKDITGVTENNDLQGTLEIALRLHPRTDTIAVISDITPTGRTLLAQFRKIMPIFHHRVDFLELDGLPAPKLVQALSNLPPQTIVLNLSFFRDPDGRVFTVSQSNNLIIKSSNCPVYVPWDFMIRDGVIGGRVVSGKRQGTIAAHLAVRILQGEHPNLIPIMTQSPNLLMLDYKALQRFGIKRSQLPPESILLNDPGPQDLKRKKQFAMAVILAGIFFGAACFLSLALIRYKKTTQALHLSEQKLQAILHSIGEPIHIKDRDLNIIWANDIAKKTFGKNIVGQKCHLALHGNPAPRDCLCTHFEVYEKDQVHTSEKTAIDINGVQRIFLVTTTIATRDRQGKAETALSIARDITDIKTIKQQFLLAKWAIDASLTPMIMADMEGRLSYANRAAIELWGYPSEQEMLGKNIMELQEQPRKSQLLLTAIKTHGVWRGESRGKKKDGTCFDMDLQLHVVKNEEGPPLSIMASALDITDNKKSEARIKYLAYFDSLTGLPNRSLLKDHMELAINHARRCNKSVAVLLLDLDNFKDINDTLGHAIGDKLLKAVSERLQKEVRSSDTLARWGGDEFILLLTDIDEIHNTPLITEKILRSLNEKPFILEGTEIVTTASIGIAFYPQDGQDGETLLKQADTAMYEAKKKGRNDYQIFSPQLERQTNQRHRMEVNLRRALREKEMFLVYQPQIDLFQGRVTGVEALVRWQCPDEGLISPAQFIPLAEEIGLIRPLGEWILRSACRQAATWQQTNDFALRLAVNLSAKQFFQPDLVQQIKGILSETGLQANLLELELTESVFLENMDVAIEALKELKVLGIQFSIDDFGTGYSSLSYLKKLPIDRIKIAQEFVRDIDTDEGDKAIVKATIAMAQSLGMNLIAEGVETQQQLSFLMSNGCNVMQGYYFAKPMLPEKIQDYIDSGNMFKFDLLNWF